MKSEHAPQTPEVHRGSVVFDERGELWERAMTAMLDTSSNIIALRGAGSFNGISKEDAKKMFTEQVVPRVERMLQEGKKLTFIFDGDNEDPNYPDIGYIMGRLLDTYHGKIDFYAVQKLGWYAFRNEWPHMRPLHSASGNEYETYIFPDDTFPGEHDHFSQNARLAQSPKYEQWYVGACGLIASKQLADYAKNIEQNDGVHNVTIFKAPVSIDQEQKIRRKIAEGSESIAELEADAVKGDFYAAGVIQPAVDKVARLTESLERRNANPYGLLFDPSGVFIQKPEYGRLHFTIVE
jgi:hypothetical protein